MTDPLESLEPDERAELLATLQFNASETLASIDEKDSWDD